MRDASERDLVARLGTDPAAFEEFYRRHVDAVTLFAVRRCPDLGAASAGPRRLRRVGGPDRRGPGGPCAARGDRSAARGRAGAVGAVSIDGLTPMQPAADPARPARRAHRAGGGRRLRLQVVAVGLAIVAGIGVVQLADVGPQQVRVGQGSVAAADVLRELAAVTERQPAAKPGAVLYAKTLERRLVMGKLDRTMWVGCLQVAQPPRHPRQLLARGCRPPAVRQTEGPGHVVPVTDTVLGLELSDLPTDPAALAKVIRASQAGRRYADSTRTPLSRTSCGPGWRKRCGTRAPPPSCRRPCCGSRPVCRVWTSSAAPLI
jgi:hypothetical protein